jgi:hypothetical protein
VLQPVEQVVLQRAAEHVGAAADVGEPPAEHRLGQAGKVGVAAGADADPPVLRLDQARQRQGDLLLAAPGAHDREPGRAGRPRS